MNKYVRRGLYIFLYICIFVAFIFIGTRNYEVKSYANDQEKFSAEYKGIPEDNNFEYLSSGELVSILKDGTGLIFFGDKENEWSNAYAEELYEASKYYNIPKIYYYDAKRIKELKNTNYYTVVGLLEGNLTTTDMTDDNLFTPSFYAVKDGKVLFYDITSAVVKNDEKPMDFWESQKESTFRASIYEALELISANDD